MFVRYPIKTVCLELVSDFSTEFFMEAFETFIGRRGIPSEVWSDNGTTFVEASRKLKDFLIFFKKIKMS